MKLRLLSIMLCMATAPLVAGCRRDSAENAFREGTAATGDEEKIGWFTKAIQADPGWAPPYKLRGYYYMLFGRYDEAVADLTQAIALEPQDEVACQIRGKAYYLNKEYDNAIADFSRAISLRPGLGALYNDRSLAYTAKGRFDDAVADCDRAMPLMPENANAFLNRAFAYTMEGRCRLAVADYTRAISMDPDCAAKAYGNRAAAYCALKEYDLAWADIRMCRDSGGKPPKALVDSLVRESGRSE